MKSSTAPRADDWRDNLPPYGEPAVSSTAPAVPPAERVVYVAPPQRRTRLGGWLVALGLGAAIAAFVIYNQNDPRTVGTQLDEAVSSVRTLGNEAGQAVAESQNAAVDASRNALAGVTTAVDDAAISLKVKTALAADPALSAGRIDVTTSQGVVRLDGPAPDAVAKERATVLASAPQGVRGVDNRLALPQAAQVVPVVDGVKTTTAQAAPQ